MSAHYLLVPGATLKVFDRFDQSQAGGLVEEDPGDSFNNGLHCAAAAERDYRASGRVYFKGHHAKIFLAWEQKRTATACIAVYLAVCLTTQEFYLWSAKLFEPLAIRTIADD